MAVTVPSTERKTRSATGNSKPRVFAEVTPSSNKKTSTTKKKKSILGKSSDDKSTVGGSGKVTKKSPIKKVKAAVNGAAKNVVKHVKKTEGKVDAKTEHAKAETK